MYNSKKSPPRRRQIRKSQVAVAEAPDPHPAEERI